VLHARAALTALARPGRILVVDEAFADTTLGPSGESEPSSLASLDLPGVIVLRSLTKTWALAGLRIGYALAAPEVIRRLAAVQPLWPVSTPALAAAIACAGPVAVAAEHAIARSLAADRAHLVAAVSEIPGVVVAAPPESSFVLLRIPNADKIRLALRDRGYAVRRGDTFPGLGPDFLRVAVRDQPTTDAFAATLSAVVARARVPS
jgi:histidinol-phosphate aminotransferase